MGSSSSNSSDAFLTCAQFVHACAIKCELGSAHRPPDEQKLLQLSEPERPDRRPKDPTWKTFFTSSFRPRGRHPFFRSPRTVGRILF